MMIKKKKRINIYRLQGDCHFYISAHRLSTLSHNFSEISRGLHNNQGVRRNPIALGKTRKRNKADLVFVIVYYCVVHRGKDALRRRGDNFL